MDTSTTRIPAVALKRCIAGIFAARGMSPEDAATHADVLCWAELRGVSSHGVQRLPMFMRTIDEGALDPRATPTLQDRGGAAFVVHGHKCSGSVAMKLALDEAQRRAKTQGVAMGILHSTTHTGAIGYYVEKAAREGFAAIMINSGPPNMAYHNAKVASLATSPIAIGVPTQGDPLVLDMATAALANGRLQQAQDLGKPIPPGAALDKNGAPTTVAKDAEILLPLGGPKGSGLSFMIEALTAIMAAHPVLMSMIAPGGKRRHVHAAMIQVFNIEAFRPLAEFKRDMSAFGEIVKALPRLDESADILLPGERGAKDYARRLRDGADVPTKAYERMVEIAAKLGVAAPRVG